MIIWSPVISHIFYKKFTQVIFLNTPDITSSCLWVENELHHLWTDFGTAKTKGYLNVNEIHQTLDSKKPKVLQLFFIRLLQKEFLENMKAFNESTDVFAALSMITTKEHYKDILPTIERYFFIAIAPNHLQ